MILVGDFFHISNNTTLVSGIKRSNFNFEFPCIFDLFVDGEFVQNIKVEGMVLDNNYYIDKAFDKITLWAYGHLDKRLIEGKTDAYLKMILL